MLRYDRLERLRNRRRPIEKRSFAAIETFAQNIPSLDYEYLVGAMQPIEEEYTEKAFTEAERVKTALSPVTTSRFRVAFDFQGSITSNTHIRTHSDIDLLAMTQLFASLEHGSISPSEYATRAIDELKALRTTVGSTLRGAFGDVVNDKPGKAISIQGIGFERKIDVVCGNWWDTDLYKRFPTVKWTRGINLYDSKAMKEIKNLPFRHNKEIDDKDKKTGGLRKVIRLLKTLKYDAIPELGISSYDIAGIVFNMTDSSLTVAAGAYLPLARNAQRELKRFIDDQNARNTMEVPNGTRTVFCSEGASLNQLMSLHDALREELNIFEQPAKLVAINFSEANDSIRRAAWTEKRPKILSNMF